ncbi:MAG: hypothetical protein ACKO37_00065 [Vampirovibrionales bacterium]
MTGLNFSTTRFNPFTTPSTPLMRPQSTESTLRFSFASSEAFSSANATNSFTSSTSFAQSLERGNYTIGTAANSILGKMEAEPSGKTYKPITSSGEELAKKFGTKQRKDYAKGWPERSEAPKIDNGMMKEVQGLYKANFPMDNKFPSPYLSATKENAGDKFDTNLELNLPRVDGTDKGAKGYHIVLGNDGSMRVKTDQGWLQNLDPETANGMLRQAIDTLKKRDDVKTEGVSDMASGKLKGQPTSRDFNYSADGEVLSTSPDSKDMPVTNNQTKPTEETTKPEPRTDIPPKYNYNKEKNYVNDYFEGLTDSLKAKDRTSKPYDEKLGSFKPQLTEANQAYPHDPNTGDIWEGEFVSTKTADGKTFYGIKQNDGTTAFSAKDLKIKLGKDSFDIDQATYAVGADGKTKAWVRQGNDWMPVTEEAFGKEEYASWMKQLGTTFGFTAPKTEQKTPPPPVSSTIA